MSKQVLKELPELVRDRVIPEETAENIRRYYAQKTDASGNRLFIVFAALGAILTGTGIILIIAHNWDDMGKGIKLFFALLPLLTGQAACGYALMKKLDSIAWREASAAFLVFAIAASISIVSQVYHIEGNLARFLMVWMILSLPVIYVMNSSLASLLCIIGVTWYGCEVSYFHSYMISWYYWLFMLVIAPHYLWLYKNKSNSNFFFHHSWLLAISITIMAGMFIRNLDELSMLLYMNVFAIFLAIGQTRKIGEGKLISNGFLIIGSLGTIILMLVMTFDFYWDEVYDQKWLSVKYMIYYTPFVVSFVIAAASIVAVGMQSSFASLNVKSYAFAAVLILFIISMAMPNISRITANLLLFAFGIFTIRDGARKDSLFLFNYGLLILTALIFCRLFDLEMSFVARGLLFILVGVGFFVTNYRMIQHRKKSAAS